jgi:hypothetical protein
VTVFEGMSSSFLAAPLSGDELRRGFEETENIAVGGSCLHGCLSGDDDMTGVVKCAGPECIRRGGVCGKRSGSTFEGMYGGKVGGYEYELNGDGC